MRNYFQAPWTLKELITALASGILLTIVGSLIAAHTLPDPSGNAQHILIGLLIQWALILTPLLIITARKHKFSWSAFGLKKVSFKEVLKLIAQGYLIFFAISILVNIFIIYSGLQIPGYQIQQPIISEFGTTTLSLTIAAIAVIGLAPLIEEIFFRGFILRTLTNKLNPLYGNIITALIFAVFHFQFSSIIPIFILGLIINSMVLKSKSIWPAIAFHTINNALAFTLEVLIITEKIPFENLT